MKVFHIGYTDHQGGAARATHRIHTGLRKIGVDSSMVVIEKRGDDPTVCAPMGMAGRLKAFAARRVERQILKWQKSNNRAHRSLGFMPSGLGRWLNTSDADVVNLHWVGGGTLSVSEIRHLKKPIVWTMHDMWPFSGAEHYENMEFPGRSRSSYAPIDRPTNEQGLDLDAWVYKRKAWAWKKKNFYLVSPSSWLAKEAHESTLFGRMPSCVIPNGIDTKMFKPLSKQEARRALNLPQGDTFILFGAISATTDRRKGFHLLLGAINQLAKNCEYGRGARLLIFGEREPKASVNYGLPTDYLGMFTDDAALARLYSAADVFVAPSLQENLPNTVMEALSCGTPCVGFRVGGMEDLIVDPACGELANSCDAKSLAFAIKEVLDRRSDELRSMCRRHAESQFVDISSARRYLDYYNNICKIDCRHSMP
jgi:glycosyltransferase involved in cell wall biosynthesis